jgi:hypothetical protein
MKWVFFLLFFQIWMVFPKSIPNGGISMFEISTRPWLYSLSQKYGRNITKLSDIPISEFQDIADKGFDIVWMMGVWSLGAYGLHHDRTDPSLLATYKRVLPDYTMEDIIGSPYAITKYKINDELGTETDLKNLRKTLNSMGMKLMLDFVPNHSAVDCPWTSTERMYYILAPKGSKPPYDPNKYLPDGIAFGSACQGCGSWTDTAQLNYWNPATRAARIKELEYVASLSDAIRCDMAYLLLNDVFQQTWSTELSSWGWERPSSEWWKDAIDDIKSQYPSIIFLAEVYYPWQQALQNVGFDFTYDKQLYDKLAQNDINSVRSWLSGNSLEFVRQSAHFISNHDEPRAAAFFGSWWRANAAALVTFTLPGMRFHWMGQWKGFTHKLDVHLRREMGEPPVVDTENFYKIFLNITNAPVFKMGNWVLLNAQGTSDAGRLLVWRWDHGTEKRLCVLNFSDSNAGGYVVVSNAEEKNGNDTIPVTDLLTGDVYYRSASKMRTQGLFVLVNSWYGQIFEY